MNIPDRKFSEIVRYIERNQPEIYWDYRDRLCREDIAKIIESREEADIFIDNFFELNLGYIFDLERTLCENINEEFFDDKEEPEDIREAFLDYIYIDLNERKLIENSGDIVCYAVVYSNYDCATSYQEIEYEDEYLGAVWQRVKDGCRKKDYLEEFYNSYTASLLHFAFRTSILDFIELKEDFKTEIIIPKGTQYSFFSSFNGSGGMFEARTVKDLVLPKVEPNMSEYDSVGLKTDVEYHYSMLSVYGQDDFIDYQNIQVR